MVAEHTAARKARTRRTAVRVAVAAVLVLGVLFGVSQLMGNDDRWDTETSGTTSTTQAEDPNVTATPEQFSNPEVAAEVEARGAPTPTPPPADTPADALDTPTLIEGEGDGAENDQILTVH